MIEIFSEKASEYSIAARRSSAVLRVEQGDAFTTGLFQLALIGDRWVFSHTDGNNPDNHEVGTVAPGDRLLVDGELFMVQARVTNSPILVAVDGD